MDNILQRQVRNKDYSNLQELNLESKIKALDIAIEQENTDVITFIMELLRIPSGSILNLLNTAIHQNKFDSFLTIFNNPQAQFLADHANGPLNGKIIEEALKYGRLLIVQYLMTTGRFNIVPVFQIAAKFGHTNILRHLLTLQVTPDLQSMINAVKGGHWEAFQFLLGQPFYKNQDLTPVLKQVLESYIGSSIVSENDSEERKFFNAKKNNFIKIIHTLLQRPDIQYLDIDPEILKLYPELLREFLLRPDYFKKYRNNPNLKENYDQALTSIPSQLEEALLDTQPGTLKDLIRHRVILHNLDRPQSVPNIPKQVSAPIPRSVPPPVVIDWSRVNVGRASRANNYYTVPELQQLLDNLHIRYLRSSRKHELIALLQQFR